MSKFLALLENWKLWQSWTFTLQSNNCKGRVRLSPLSLTWYTWPPQLTSGLQLPLSYTWHTPLLYVTFLDPAAVWVFNPYLVPRMVLRVCWTAPIPTQTEQGSNMASLTTIYSIHINGVIHTYRQIHFAAWIIFSLTLKKKQQEGRIKGLNSMSGSEKKLAWFTWELRCPTGTIQSSLTWTLYWDEDKLT